jgi:protein-disulfide isomerase
MKTFLQLVMAAALLLPLGAQTAPTAQDANKNEGITREQADEILKELRQIRQLLEKQANPAAKEPQRAALDLTGYQMLGDKNAPLTMVEFTDYQCPFCQRFHMTVFDELKKNYIDTGKVRFYSKDLPLDSLHPNAFRAAQAARCAAEQGQFWRMRDLMAANPNKLDMDSLVTDAADLKMDPKAFRGCVESNRYRSAVEADVAQAEEIGADGTPTFVIGKSTASGVDGEVLVGAMPYSTFDLKLKGMAAGK